MFTPFTENVDDTFYVISSFHIQRSRFGKKSPKIVGLCGVHGPCFFQPQGALDTGWNRGNTKCQGEWQSGLSRPCWTLQVTTDKWQVTHDTQDLLFFLKGHPQRGGLYRSAHLSMCLYVYHNLHHLHAVKVVFLKLSIIWILKDKNLA